MNETNFDFGEYDVEKLKKQQYPELIKNLEQENASSPDDIKKHIKKDFIEIDFPFEEKHMSDQISLQEHELGNSQEIAIPYDPNPVQGNTYLSLVLSPNLKELELMIRGLEYVRSRNPVTGREEYLLRKIQGHPLNEYGINQIITQLKIYTSTEIKLGRKTTRGYYNSVIHIGKSITRLIYKNLHTFGMDTQEKQRNAKTFCNAIIEMIDASYSRSIEGQENHLSRATEFSITGSIDGLDNPNERLFGRRKKDGLKN
jgi:hypothetical protein